MNRFRPTLLAALLAASLALLAGCGGDSDSTGSGGDTQPAADLVAQADEICSAAKDERPKAPTLSEDATPQQFQAAADYFEADLEITQDTYDQLSELTPPEGLEDQWQTVLDLFQAVIDGYPAAIDAAKAEDFTALSKAVGQTQEKTKDLLPAAAEVGLQVCANPN